MTLSAISNVTRLLTAMLFTVEKLVAVLWTDMFKLDAAFGVTLMLSACLVFEALFFATDVAVRELLAWNCFLLTTTAAANLRKID
jgi:hypothetical protein